MKQLFIGSLLAFSAASLAAADCTIDSNQFKVGIDLKGGVISSLQNKSKQSMIMPGRQSYNDRIFSTENGVLTEEKFGDLEFSVVDSNYKYNKFTDITLTAKGIASFDWLRITKKYTFYWNKNNFSIKYTFKNIDTVPHKAGLWCQTFLTMGEGATLFQPQGGKIVEVKHPGAAKSDEWCLNPALALAGITGKETPHGMVLTILPAEKFGGSYSWCGIMNNKPANTFEVLTKEMQIAPGKEVSFTIESQYTKNVRSLLNKLSKQAQYQIKNPSDLGINTMKHILPKISNRKTPKKFVDVKVKRQFFNSVRAITIPADEKITKCAAYVLMNKAIEYDRPLPSKLIAQADGSKKLLFEVPGLNERGGIYSKIIDGKVYDVSNESLLKGKSDITVRIALDALHDSPQLAADRPEIFYNGSFEKPNKANNFADGNLWYELTRSAKRTFWEKGGIDNSYCIRLKLENKRGTAAYSQIFMPEADRKYTVSADVKCENPDKKYIICYVDCFDEKDKPIPKGKIIYSSFYASVGWTKVKKTFSVPANAVKLRVIFQLSPAGKENVMWIDNVSLTADDFSFKAKPPLETARENAIYSGYAPLHVLEKISHDYVTPHEKWFKPAAFELPELLYCCAIVKTNEDASRREIVEIAQRLDLKYNFIPLLPTITNLGGKGTYGVHSVEHGPQMTDYTLERLRALKTAPKAAIFQAVDFKKFDANKTLTAEIIKLQNQGTRIIFLDCYNIPSELLGSRKAMPAEWLQIPHMQPGNPSVHMNRFSKADMFMFGTPHYVNLSSMPSTPKKQVGTLSAVYVGRDFPFYEYRYLVLAKSIRDAFQVAVPKVIGNKFDGKAIELKVKSPKAEKISVALEFKSVNRESDGKIVKDFTLKSGEQTLKIDVPALPGGVHIAHIQLLNAQKKVLDASAMRFDTPETSKTTIKFADAEHIYLPGKPVKFNVKVSGAKAGDKLAVTVEDTDFRTVYSSVKDAKDADFSVNLLPPYTILYRVFAKLERNGKVIARSMDEFSVPSRKLDPTDFHAGMWGGRLILADMLRQNGFDLISSDGRRDNIKEGTLRNITNLNMYPLILNLSWVANDTTANRKYRADKASDPVRDPCYSDPAVTKAAEDGLKTLSVKNKFRYYAGLYHMLGDEMFLGSTICYSEHCLKGFREYLKKQYGTIAKLNKTWNCNYKDFSEVVPVQRNVVENTDNLAPWLEHKMFMVNVWAHNFVGKRIEFIKDNVPGAQVGMSGTQVPGYSYDWAQLMKHLGCTAYYNGVQTTLVNQWQPEGSLSGQWGGGYVCPGKLYDVYQRSYHWSNLIKGANMVWNWHGSAYNGDGSPSENLKSYCEEFNLLKRGLAKLLLTSDKNNSEVAVLYSQSSMFTAMAGGIGVAEWQNTQTGWEELLLDLKLTARYITYEQLADKKFDLSQFKVIILPLALSLSQAEREALVKFAENGGTVIADALPGRYDFNGKRISNTVLDKLFPANSGKIAPVMKDLKETLLNGRFRIAEPALGTIKVTACGKGRGILMNVMLNSYQSLSIGGVGGETATSASGSEAYCLSMRKLIGKIAQESNARAHARVTGKNGLQMPCQSVLKKAGENYYFAVVRHNDIMKIGKIDNTAPDAPVIKVELPVSGAIYDVREGKKIASGNTFTVKAASGYGQLFAVLPNEITAVSAAVPASVKAGNAVNITCNAAGAKSRTVYRLEVTDPSGKIAKEYSLNSCFETPAGSFTFQIPYNAQPGSWKAAVIHVASGKRIEKTFAVK